MNNQNWLKIAKQRFDFDNWPCPSDKSALFDKQNLILLNVEPIAETWNLERRLPIEKGYSEYYKSAKNDKHRIMLRISNYLNYNDAYSALLKKISSSSARTLPRLDKLGINIGDVGFTGYGTIYTSIIFVRHNVLADVRSIGNESISVIEFAQEVDHKIKNLASL